MAGEITSAANAAATQIQTLIDNAGIADTYKTYNVEQAAEANVEVENSWMEKVKAAYDNHTLTESAAKGFTADGEGYKTNIAHNLQDAIDAAAAAENTEYERIQGLIGEQETAYAKLSVSEDDVKSAGKKSVYETLLTTTQNKAAEFHTAGTSVKNKATNEGNIQGVADAIKSLEGSVANYKNYVRVNAVIETVQKQYNKDILDLTEKLAGNEIYQDTYEEANKALNEVSALIVEVTKENKDLYDTDTPAYPSDSEYDALISKIKYSNATAAVKAAKDLYVAQEDAKAKADAAIATAKDGVTNANALAYIDGIENEIMSEYKKHDLSADDYSTKLANVMAYTDQLNLLQFHSIACDQTVFSHSVTECYQAIQEAKDLVVYENGALVSTNTIVSTAVSDANAKIDALNNAAKAEKDLKDELDQKLGQMTTDLNAAYETIKVNYNLVAAEYSTKKADIEKQINDIKKAVADAYTQTAEAAADPVNTAVQKVNSDNASALEALSTTIKNFVSDAKKTYDAEVDKSNAACAAQMKVDLKDINDKLEAAKTTLATYNDSQIGGPDYVSSEAAALKELINAQQAKVNEAVEAEEAARNNGVHNPTLVTLLADVDKALYGDNYPTDHQKVGGIYKQIDVLLQTAVDEKNAYEANKTTIATIQGYYDAAVEKINSMESLTAAETEAWLAKANTNKTENIDPLTTNNKNHYVTNKDVVTYKTTVDGLKTSEKDFFDALVFDAYQQNAYNFVVASIAAAKTQYSDSIAAAKTSWAEQYSQISGIYAQEFKANGKDYKADLNKALAAYQKELTTDITELNKLVTDVANAEAAAKEDAESCYYKKVSADKEGKVICDAHIQFSDKYTDAIKEVAEHISKTANRAKVNRTKFEAQIGYITELTEKYNKGINELGSVRAYVEQNKNVNIKDGELIEGDYTSAQLEAAQVALEAVKAKIAALEADICEQHINGKAALYAPTAADTYAKLSAELIALRTKKISDYREELAAENAKIYDYIASYADQVKADVYDVDLKKILAYGSYKHADYSEQVEGVKNAFFGLANQLRTIVKDAKDAEVKANEENKYFDHVKLEYWDKVDAVSQAIKDEYDNFVAATEPIAQEAYKAIYDKVGADIEEAATAVESYTGNPNYRGYKLKKYTNISKYPNNDNYILAKIGTDAEKAIEGETLAPECDALIERLNAINVVADWNADAQYDAGKVVDKAQALVDAAKEYKYSDTTMAYNASIQNTLNNAIDAQQEVIDEVKNEVDAAYAELTLHTQHDDILDKLTGIEAALAEAKLAADDAQQKILEDAANKDIYDGYITKYNSLVTKYLDAVETVKAYNSEVVNDAVDICDPNLEGLGGEDLDCNSISLIYILKKDINSSYSKNSWTINYDEKIAEYDLNIDDILEAAAKAYAGEQADGAYGVVVALYAEADALVQPYNRAEVNKGETAEAKVEATAIFNELSDLISKFKTATDNWDAAGADKTAAGDALKAIAKDSTAYETQLENLAKRIEKLDQELQAYIRLTAALDEVEDPQAYYDEEIAAIEDEDVKAGVEAAVAEKLEAALKAVEDAQTAVKNSHANNAAHTDEDADGAKITAAKTAVEDLKTAIKNSYDELTLEARIAESTAAHEKLYGEVEDKINELATAYRNINKNVRNQFVSANTEIKDKLDEMQAALNEKHNPDAQIYDLKSTDTNDFTEVNTLIDQMKADGAKAYDDYKAANKAAQDEIQAAIDDMKALYDETMSIINSIDIDELHAFEADFDEINPDAVVAADYTTATKQAGLDKVAEIKEAIQKIHDDASAARDKWLSKGDLDKNGKVQAADYTKVLAIVSGVNENPTDDENYLSDINCDDNIDVADLTNLANIILGKTDLFKINGLDAKARNANDAENTVEAIADGNNLSVSLSNMSEIAALQFDMVLPEGVTVADAQTAARAKGLNVYVNTLADGTVRVVVASMSNKAIEGTEGDVLNIATLGAGFGDIELTNVVAASVDGQRIQIGNVLATAPTAIKTVSASDIDLAGARVFNANGVQTNGLTSGINVVVLANGQKVKVAVK